jgi:hypothetical protein
MSVQLTNEHRELRVLLVYRPVTDAMGMGVGAVSAC